MSYERLMDAKLTSYERSVHAVYLPWKNLTTMSITMNAVTNLMKVTFVPKFNFMPLVL